jgi:hypothetical protein
MQTDPTLIKLINTYWLKTARCLQRHFRSKGQLYSALSITETNITFVKSNTLATFHGIY